MKTDLEQNEELIKKGSANFQKGIEAVGGKLYLTNQRLIFEAHAINFQGGTTIIHLSNIVSIEKIWTKFLNLVPIMPNSLAVNAKLYTGSQHVEAFKFVLFGRSAWEIIINESIQTSTKTGV